MRTFIGAKSAKIAHSAAWSGSKVLLILGAAQARLELQGLRWAKKFLAAMNSLSLESFGWVWFIEILWALRADIRAKLAQASRTGPWDFSRSLGARALSARDSKKVDTWSQVSYTIYDLNHR